MTCRKQNKIQFMGFILNEIDLSVKKIGKIGDRTTALDLRSAIRDVESPTFVKAHMPKDMLPNLSEADIGTIQRRSVSALRQAENVLNNDSLYQRLQRTIEFQMNTTNHELKATITESFAPCHGLPPLPFLSTSRLSR